MSASKADWERYIQDYKNSMPAPTPDNIADYAKQLAYLQWLESTYKQYENDWENIPDIIPMTSKAASGIYQSRLDHEFHAVIIAPFSGESTVMAQSDEFNVTVSMETYSGGTLPEVSAEYYEDSQNIGVQTMISQSGYNVKQDLAGAPYFTDSTYNNGNTGSYFYTCIIYIPKTGTPGEQSQNTFGSAYSFIGTGSPATIGTGGLLTTITGDIDTANPWDYYNNDILPNVDPDNAAFPDGWEPPGPGNDPDDGPEDDEAPDKTDWGDQDEPWGDFYPTEDFNNYAAFNAIGINQLKVSLWDSPDDFWEALSILGSNSANYLDYLVSLRVYPYDITAPGDIDTLYLGRGGQITLPGGAGAFTHYGVPMKITMFPFEIKAEKHYNNFLDFAPYTKAQIYLPFSGVWELNPKYVYHTTLKIFLYLDITDGSGVWEVYNAEHGKRLLIKQCKIGIELPLSGNDAIGQSSQIVNATLGIAQTITGGVPKITNSVASTIKTAANSKADGLDVAGAGVSTAAQLATTGLDVFSAATNLANANREIPCYTGGTTGLAAAQQGLIPTLTLIRPVVENPESFPHTVGHLVNKASKLEKLSGFTTCRNVDVSNVGQATDKEKAQLKQILEGGFYSVAG